VINQRLREREHHRLVLLDDRERFLIAVLDEGGTARVGAQIIPARALAAYTSLSMNREG
jgi:hypothetical protein